jgi:hypothetical protein
MYDLTQFSLRDMTECGSALRKLGSGASCMEEVAGLVVRYLQAHLGISTGEPACALVRFFTTQPFDELNADRQAVATTVLGLRPNPRTKCVTLIGSAGIEPHWNDTSLSRRYKAVPLVSEQFVQQFPMFTQLFTQLGLVLTEMLAESNILADRSETTYNVFHVQTALGSPYVPVQEEFVVKYGIQSVLGFGGVLPSGEVYAVILFATVSIPAETAELFRTLALCVKLAVLPFDGGPMWVSEASQPSPSEVL